MPAQKKTAALRSRFVTAAGALALAMVLAACGSSASADGPLGPPEAHGYVCVYVYPADDDIVTNGSPYVQNISQTTAVIDKVGLIDAHGLKLITTWAVPVGHVYYGAQPGYPPGPFPLAKYLPGFQWAKRRNAVGATIPPTDGNHATELLFVIRMLAKQGTMTGVDVWYHAGGYSYLFSTPYGMSASLVPKVGDIGDCPKIKL